MEEDIKILENLSKEFKTYNDLDGIQDLKPYITAIENLIKGYRELEENLKIATAMLTKGQYPEKNKGDNDFSKQFIPKSKIREMLEELKEIKRVQENNPFTSPVYIKELEYGIQILEELLEGE